MVSMTAPTGRKMIFLTDPIEDRARDWGDYKRNYEATFTAELLYPMTDNYEVMPWPERIFTRPYRLPNSDSSALIPKYYSTQMLVMVNALNHVPLSDNKVSGAQGIGVLMGNSLMFQRFPTHNSYEDPQFSNFYGQTLPLVKRGVPVETVHMENLSYPATLKHIKVLVMSYSNMKPMSPEVHQQLADWVRKGGCLVYCGADSDPYQGVMEWWNTKGNHFKAPSEHLFQLLGIRPAATGKQAQRFSAGKGTVYVIRQDPKEFVMQENGDKAYLNMITRAYQDDAKAGQLTWKNSFFLRRGPYDLVSVMDEGVSAAPYVVKGPVIDLFDPKLPVLKEKTVNPGQQAFLYDLSQVKDKQRPTVLASASRIYDEQRNGRSYTFTAKGPLHTVNSMRVLLPSRPGQIGLTGKSGKQISPAQTDWDALTHTLYISCDNDPDGVKVRLGW
ncbi:hypothetical protein [Compostibacter hankyongensis]|uniref:Uncharacterized protein n=1 Tax=Compostibacter hankyongensis TaxID=1007089 RepID=A0ABP8G1E9_9BACT